MESWIHCLCLLHRMVLHVLGTKVCRQIWKKELLHLDMSCQYNSIYDLDDLWEFVLNDFDSVCCRIGVFKQSCCWMDVHDGANSKFRLRLHWHNLPGIKLINILTCNTLLLVDQQRLAILHRHWVHIADNFYPTHLALT